MQNFDGREWTTLGERGSLLAGEGWRYTIKGGVRHYISFEGISPTAICGVGVWRDQDWLGTGNQSEYERLASLPRCLRCMQRFSKG